VARLFQGVEDMLSVFERIRGEPASRRARAASWR
jgi:hypothetical protein